MNFISICSGIEAASVAFGPLGWKAIAFSEIEPFPSAVLAHHYPEVPNLGDMTKFANWPKEIFLNADAIVGGPPCQAFSVAGLRKGLTDARGNLTLTYVELINHADAIRLLHGKPPVIVLYENVPGLLSDKTNAFGCFLGALAGEDGAVIAPRGKWTDAGCVFGPQRTSAWRLFDAQYHGVAQRRRRVFVVASARKGFDPAQVLFEWDGVRRDTAPSREARQVAPTIPARSTAGGGLGTDFDCDGGTICVATGQAGAEIGADMAPTLNCNHEAPYVAHSLDCAQGVAAENIAPSMGAKNPTAVAFGLDQELNGREELAGTLQRKGEGGFEGSVMTPAMQVRRLTPVECERLQGFPDGPRYKALGNSWAVPNVRWIGRRIDTHLRALSGDEIEPMDGK